MKQNGTVHHLSISQGPGNPDNLVFLPSYVSNCLADWVFLFQMAQASEAASATRLITENTQHQGCSRKKSFQFALVHSLEDLSEFIWYFSGYLS